MRFQRLFAPHNLLLSLNRGKRRQLFVGDGVSPKLDQPRAVQLLNHRPADKLRLTYEAGDDERGSFEAVLVEDRLGLDVEIPIAIVKGQDDRVDGEGEPLGADISQLCQREDGEVVLG